MATAIVDTLKDDEINEETLDKDEKDSLYNNHSTGYTVCMLIGLLINVGLLLFSHIGLSAIVTSSICPTSIESCPQTNPPDGPDGAINVCSNNTDDVAILVPGNPAYDEFADYMSTFGRQCFISPPAGIPAGVGCVQFLVNRDYGISIECGACFQEEVDCSIDNCVSPCLVGTAQECQDCSFQFCVPRFLECVGIDLVPAETDLSKRALDEDSQFFNDGCLDKTGATLFNVFDLTFFNSIEKSWTGGSKSLAVLVAVASGFWPYMKNVLMFAVWFLSLRNARREKILRLLAVLGKWSLVDVFAVVLIMNGVNIQKIFTEEPFSPLVVLTEPKLSIYAFGIAAIWALAQGELMRHLSRKHKLRTNTTAKNTESKKNVENKAETDALTGIKPNVTGLRIGLGLSALCALGLGFAGVLSENLRFTISGLIVAFQGPNDFSFNTIELATKLVDECKLYEGYEGAAGVYFLSILFFLMCAVIPFVTYLLYIVFALVFKLNPDTVGKTSGDKTRTWVVSITLGLSNFAAMDVYFLSLLTLTSQFEGLIQSAIGNSIDEQCGVDPSKDEFCIKFVGTFGIGTWLILGSVVFFWAAQVFAGRLVAVQERHRLIY